MVMHPTTAEIPLPPEFDLEAYRAHNPDLAGFSDDRLVAHYEHNGIEEGRRTNVLASRSDFVALIPPEAKALEIGPFHQPLLRGTRTKYFDVLPQVGLMERARCLDFATANVPHIDYVSDTGDLTIVDDTFAYVLSSHCVEHQPDLIAHLRNVEALLENGGRYFALIPDKRYCFDHFIAESSLADVLAAHHDRRHVHSLKSVLEHRVLTTHNDSGRHWAGDHGIYLHAFEARTRATLQEFASANGAYVDVHAWFFTPSGMRLIATALKQLDYIGLALERLYPTRRNSNEFWCVFRKP